MLWRPYRPGRKTKLTVAHAVSLSYARSDHISPTALVLAAVMHGVVGLALWWISPLSHVDRTDDPVEITMEQDPAPQIPPTPTPAVREPPPPQEAAVAPPPPPPLPPPAAPPAPQPTPPRVSPLSAPIGTTLDPKAQLGAQPPDPKTTPTMESNSAGPATPKAADTEAKAEAEKPEPAKPEPAQPPKAEQPQPEIAKPEESKPQVAAVQPEPAKPEPESKPAAEQKPDSEKTVEPPKPTEPEKSAEPENKPEPPKEQQQAALALPPTPPLPQAPLPPAPPLPPMPPAPTLESALPPLDAPPPPVTAREIPAPPPPPPPPPPAPKPAPQAPAAKPAPPPQHAQQAPPQRQQLFSSPLSNVPQQPAPNSQQASRSTSPTFVNPAEAYGVRKAQEDYFWAVVRKMAQYQFQPKLCPDIGGGEVVGRFTIGRDGRLLDVSVAKSSGCASVDSAMIEIARQASPYPPLPADIRGDRHIFTVPLNYGRAGPR